MHACIRAKHIRRTVLYPHEGARLMGNLITPRRWLEWVYTGRITIPWDSEVIGRTEKLSGPAFVIVLDKSRLRTLSKQVSEDLRLISALLPLTIRVLRACGSKTANQSANWAVWNVYWYLPTNLAYIFMIENTFTKSELNRFKNKKVCTKTFLVGENIAFPATVVNTIRQG